MPAYPDAVANRALPRRAERTATLVGAVAAFVVLQGAAHAQSSPLNTPESITAAPTPARQSVQRAPSQVGPTTSPGIAAQTTSNNAEDARIDALRQRGVVNVPTVSDTLADNIGGFRSTLADYGIGVGGILTGQFTGDVLDLPSRTNGTQRYVGQTGELDSTNGYVGATYDLGRIGLTDGLADLQACYNTSTVGQYPHGVRVCALYWDQPLLNRHLDIQAGIVANNYQYANPFVGGSVSSGSLGPSANLITELGLSVGGVGAPGVNVTVNVGPWYSKWGVQRSTSLQSTVYEAQEANPYGVRWSEPGSGVVLIDELGYRRLAAPGIRQTWVRMAGVGNTSEYSYYPGRKSNLKGQGAGMYLLADHQFTQIDPAHPRRGLYAGLSYLYATPAAYTYDQYFEGRIYGIGVLNVRPRDQISFIANRTDASAPYMAYLHELHDQTHKQIYNFTLSYTYRVMRGTYLNGGIVYVVDPALITNARQGNPLLFKLVAVVYL